MEPEKALVLEAISMEEIGIPIVSEKVEILPMTKGLSCNSVCAFSRQEHSVLASKESSKSARKLSLLIAFYAVVMVVEVIGGVKAHSLSVISDAAHLLSDIAGFSVSLFAVWASGWAATPHQSFGYNRLEVLGALLSVQFIWMISGYLIYEAVGRLLHQNERVNGMLMFAIAAFGFVLNLIMVVWLGHDHHHGFGGNDHCHHHHHHHGFGDSDHGHDHDDHGHSHSHSNSNSNSHSHSHSHSQFCGDSDHDHGMEEVELAKLTDEEENLSMLPGSQRNVSVLNFNLQGAYLHVMADMIQSIGVMIGGAVIWAKPEWFIVDLLCTLLFSVLSLSTTVPMLRNIYGILTEGAPSEINVIQVENGLRSIKGVLDVHDLHIWAITVGKNVLSCHVVAEPGINSVDLLGTIKHYCEKSYQIQHVTIQIE
ncbi:metal tolerance protein B-like [Lotus japonicus]|uniref:metal tolerance protein B-like n=1 Tax=Lotus japonicus TaxID=34305 RepID=UPI00258A922E|nr:metal tolerance protein B-like [Lotus japonicus]